MSLLQAIPRFTRRAVRRPEAVRFGAFAWLAAPTVALALATLGFEQTLRTIERLPQSRPRRAGALGLDEAVAAVAWAFRLHIGLRGQCLERALVQYALHRLDGVPAQLVIGVRREHDRGVNAHAWVEVPGAAPRGEYEPLLTRQVVSR